MGFFADIYVIKKSRSKKLGEDFLNHFLPNREESASEYELPQYSDDPKILFNKAYDLMEYLEKNNNDNHTIYWRNLDSNNPNRHGMIFYTTDGYMIFGISVDADPENEAECLSEMKDFLKSDRGYITYECPPETTFEEFEKKIITHHNKD